MALTLIKLLQFFEFFNLLNLDYPANLLVFFELFKGDIFNFMPNIFSKVLDDDDTIQECEPSGRMRDESMSCSFLENSGQFLTLIFMLCIVKLFILAIKMIFRLKFKPSKLNKIGQ